VEHNVIECQDFYKILEEAGLEFYAGVPDSLLKNFCFFVDDALPSSKHIITANEGSAVGLATGYHLATGKIPVVYLQNSGLGNTINPLLSIADPEVYSIPMLLIIGWRGEPGVKDEPQHKKQGKVMLEMLKSMNLPYEIIDGATDIRVKIKHAVSIMQEEKRPFVFAIREGSFGDYKFKGGAKNDYPLTREATIENLLDAVKPDDVVVCTTGKASRELYELRIKRQEFERADFLTVGAMGHSSQIALGVALQRSEKKVFCFDGDGSLLMHMGGFATIGKLAPKNYVHIMINNGAHESVGGQDTGAFMIDWSSIAKGCGYKNTFLAKDLNELQEVTKKLSSLEGPIFFEVRTSQGSRKDLGRPKSTPIENKLQFMKALDK
jgi:phosphonopyruvate decarboxylase